MENESLREMYRECLRNHAAKLGTFASDGCCEFIPGDDSDLGIMHCGACGCHRNFHRKVYSSPPPSGGAGRLLLLQAEGAPPELGRRRPRTRFSAEQKARMSRFAEKIGWRLPKSGSGADHEVDRFCGEIGIGRQVFKVWLHNHKGSVAAPPSASDSNGGAVTPPLEEEEEEEEEEEAKHD